MKERKPLLVEYRIAICTGAWQRPKLFELFCKHYQELCRLYPIELFISVSENSSMEVAKRYGHEAILISNDSLYTKMNVAVQTAQNMNPDYCLMIGSDDFLSHSFFDYYFSLFDKKIDYIYPLDWYFFDASTKRGLYWGGYRKEINRGMACGAGRCLSRNILHQIQWAPWIAGYDRVLDTGMDINLKKIKYTSHGFYLKEQRIFAVDIKTSTNMTPFAMWDNTILIDGKTMLFDGIDNYEEIFNFKE